MAEIINALPQGMVLKGPKNRYQIQRVLGQGTFGITYLATTETQVSGQMGSFTAAIQVAVKEFFMKDINGREGYEVTSSSQGSYFTDYKRKFLREAENLSKLQHLHIVKVLESFETNGTAYYAMEYLEGGSLDHYIQQKGALTEAEALPLIRQIGSALEEMHTHQMLHLDLKPGNVMLRKTGEAVLIDFGLSKQFDEKGEPESSTKLGGGTLGYAPIEQANYQRGDGLPVTMDVYALGATLYKMLTGERPPEASLVLNEGLPTDRLQQKGVAANTIAVIEKAMFPMLKKRYQNVREMLEALGGSKPSSSNAADEKTIVDKETVEMPIVDKETNKKENPKEESITRPKEAMDTPRKPSGMKYAIIATVTILSFLFLGFLWKSQNEGDTTTASIQTFTVKGVSFNMIPVKGGTFEMGVPEGTFSDLRRNGAPMHSVTLSSFYICETEVTQALWQAVMGSNPSCFKGSNRPVENVSWDDCQEFISKLNTLTGKTFLLPTEAEWEFAARGGKKSQGYKYSGSDNLSDVAWYFANNDSTTHEVRTKYPNELGIYDMSGNVSEWCQDWNGSYSEEAQTNPTGATSGKMRQLRGGGWISFNGISDYHVARRSLARPDLRLSCIGFRFVLREPIN